MTFFDTLNVPSSFQPTIERLLSLGITQDQITLTCGFMNQFDPSHDFIHVLRVVSLSFAIFDREIEQNALQIPHDEQPKISFILACCALFHDVNDHKYATDTSIHQNIFQQVLSPIQDVADRDAITAIIDAISYSKEVKRGGVPDLDTILQRPFMLHLRNIVSDADKIDAIGRVGVARCAHYSLHVARTRRESSPTSDSPQDTIPPLSQYELVKQVVEHSHEKLLRLHPLFVRTDAGKAIGGVDHEFTVQWVHDAELWLQSVQQENSDLAIPLPSALDYWSNYPSSTSC